MSDARLIVFIKNAREFISSALETMESTRCVARASEMKKSEKKTK